MAVQTWPKALIDALGRPLQRWDICPTCGQAASSHIFNPVAQELRCPGDVAKATYLDEADFNRERVRQEQQAREIERREQVLKDRRAKLEAEAARQQQRAKDINIDPRAPAPLDVDAKRAYFEE